VALIGFALVALSLPRESVSDAALQQNWQFGDLNVQTPRRSRLKNQPTRSKPNVSNCKEPPNRAQERWPPTSDRRDDTSDRYSAPFFDIPFLFSCHTAPLSHLPAPNLRLTAPHFDIPRLFSIFRTPISGCLRLRSI
jgi:hypothetical protein